MAEKTRHGAPMNERQVKLPYVPQNTQSANEWGLKIFNDWETKIRQEVPNHSLRATGATALYQAGVTETIIKRQTGHQSADGLRKYECSSTQH